MINWWKIKTILSVIFNYHKISWLPNFIMAIQFMELHELELHDERINGKTCHICKNNAKIHLFMAQDYYESLGPFAHKKSFSALYKKYRIHYNIHSSLKVVVQEN